MKKQKSSMLAGAGSTTSLMENLLTQEATAGRQAELVHGVVVATLLELLPDGQVRIALPSHGITSLCARPVCALQALHEGAMVAVMFEQGDTTRALVLGPMAGLAGSAQGRGTVLEAGTSQAAAAPYEALVDQQRIVIEAQQEIELRCGDAAIIMTRDGRILLRGAYISSHASATQRIRGGSVQIN